MDRILIVGASSDLSKSYIDYIFNSEITIDILVRDLSKFSKKFSIDLTKFMSMI